MPCIEYQIIHIGIFKNDGRTGIGVLSHELDDMLPEYQGCIVLEAQHIGVQLEFLLLKAIQELKTEIDILRFSTTSSSSETIPRLTQVSHNTLCKNGECSLSPQIK